MSLEEILVARFGPLMTYADMAALFGLGGSVAADALRQRMRRDKVLGARMRSCSVRFGRRTYFRADLIAQALGNLTGTEGLRVDAENTCAKANAASEEVAPPQHATAPRSF